LSDETKKPLPQTISLTMIERAELYAWRDAAIAEEREACAAICDRYATALDYGGNQYIRSRDAQSAAIEIRRRSK
jgi:hypothetical protein